MMSGDVLMAMKKTTPSISLSLVIDLFLTDKFTLQKVSATTTGVITSSDHAPISIELLLFKAPGSPLPWRLNSSLLANQT